MNRLHSKRFCFCLFFLLTASCGSVYRSMVFDPGVTPQPPDYSKADGWAVLPGIHPDFLEGFDKNLNDKNADVFYVYPTLFTDKKNSAWNADIGLSTVRNQVRQTAVKYQASSWLKSANLYVPFYRQAHYRIFVETYSQQGAPAWEIAYQDVKNAFEYYLKNYNKGKPIIIAAHSQGSMHAKRLIKEFFDQKPLQNQLVAAYLIGTRILPDEFQSIEPLTSAEATGGFVSWNSYKMNKIPKNFESWFKGGVTTNPIRWDTQKHSVLREHQGVLNKDLVVYPNSVSIEVTNGVLWTSLPKIPGRFFLAWIKNYHFADINLFWKDIESNALLRVQSWYKKRKG